MEGDYTDDPGVVIRNLKPEDFSRLVAIDEKITGRSRHLWYEGKLKRALEESDLQVSLGAESDGLLVGAMFAEVRQSYPEIEESRLIKEAVRRLIDRCPTSRRNA